MEISINKLLFAMANACYSCDDLGKISGISASTISRIKTGKFKPRPKTIGKLAKALNVDIRDLIEEVN